MDTSKRILPEHEAEFPNLFPTGYGKASEEDFLYNCIAWAVDEKNTEECWNPFCIGNGYYWPDGLERNSDLETFVKLFKIEGDFDPSEDNSSELEAGFDKVAIFVNSENEVTHATRQKEDGIWASKLGDWEDIEHRKLEGLCGDANKTAYGRVAKILKRPRQSKGV